MKFQNPKINGFSCYDTQISVYDRSGRLFYFILNPASIEITFNLPEGIFSTENRLVRLPKKVNYILPPLPEPEKDIDIRELNLIVEKNPNKASIDVATGDSYIDPAFMQKEAPMVTFVIFHELSHNLYKTEWKCDINAAAEMIKRGYNPSQCFYASEVCLSDRKTIRFRKEKLYNFLKKIEIQ